MQNILSCNIGSYGKYRDGAYEHLVQLGVKQVEIGAPALADVEEVCDRVTILFGGSAMSPLNMASLWCWKPILTSSTMETSPLRRCAV